MPNFYIGSTSIDNIQKGYRGSVTSVQYGKIWKNEIKNNPKLFYTYMIPNQFCDNKIDKLHLELKWQKAFDVVRNPMFLNMSFARKGFFATTESAMKAVDTRRRNNKYIDSDETRLKRSLSAIGKPKSNIVKDKIRSTMTGRKRPIDVVNKIRNTRHSNGYHINQDTRHKLRIIQSGRKMWNNGIVNTWAKDQPGQDWILGKLKPSNN